MANVATRRWLNYEDAAAHLGVSPRQMKRWAAEGKVPFTKLGGRVRFDPDKLDEWLAAQSFDPSGDESA